MPTLHPSFTFTSKPHPVHSIKITLTAALLFLATTAQAQTLTWQVDDFSGDSTLVTEPYQQVCRFRGKSSPNAYIGLYYADGATWLGFRIEPVGVATMVGPDDVLQFKFADGSVVDLPGPSDHVMSGYGEGSRKGYQNSLISGFDLRLSLTAEVITALAEKELTDIRLTTDSGYVTGPVKAKDAQGLLRLASDYYSFLRQNL